jgi:cytochrome c-type biogenesis protein CcmH/NrfG
VVSLLSLIKNYLEFFILRRCLPCNSDEPKAEQECEKSLATALKIDSENLDALQTLANLRLIRAKDDEARTLLKRMVKLMLDNRDNLPAIEFRMVTCRLLVEL